MTARELPAAELDAYVERVARSIADLPEGVIAGMKATLPPEDLTEGFAREEAAWGALVSRPETQQLMADAVAMGVQTPEGERDLEGLMRSLPK
jgi:hypothetical protein